MCNQVDGALRLVPRCHVTSRTCKTIQPLSLIMLLQTSAPHTVRIMESLPVNWPGYTSSSGQQPTKIGQG